MLFKKKTRKKMTIELTIEEIQIVLDTLENRKYKTQSADEAETIDTLIDNIVLQTLKNE